MKKLLLNLLCITFTFQSYSQGINKPILGDNKLMTSLDSIVSTSVQNYLKDSLTVGISIGIIQKGKISTYNYGEIRKNSYQVPNDSTIYEIGSISKTFTGILLARAVVDKKMKLDDDIRKYLGEKYPNLQYKNNPIRLIDLSNHTSGIPSNTDNIENQKPFDLTNPFANYTAEMFEEGLHNIIIDTTPGIRQSYSNMGVALLGKLISKRYGKPYMDLIRENILVPAGMIDTKVSLTREELKRFAIGYNRKGEMTSYWDCGEFIPAGGIRSTVRDMLKYVLFNLSGDSAVVLSHQKTFGTYQNGVALTWGINEPKKDQPLFWHEGSTGGFTAICVVIPAEKSGFVILTNSKTEISLLTSDLIKYLMDI